MRASTTRARVYNLLRRTMSQGTRNRLKRDLARMRKRLGPLYRIRFGAFDAQDLCAELASRLTPETEIVMVHCSVNNLEPMYIGTVSELLDGLIELCGAKRTLAMPAFFLGGADTDPAAYYRRTPAFDARRQPSQMGILSELFRRRAGVLRSLHPTASVCALGRSVTAVA